jgi:GntR family transcriptional regulator, rspAB operon transcriptional repressor
MTLLSQPTGPISKTSLAESVYQRILEAILTGMLPGGTELNEVTLAGELGVSRTPVHEALQRLVADGLVEHLPNRRDRVAQFSRDDVREIYEMRIILEGAIAERAARRLDAEELASLQSEADALAAAANGRNWTARVLDFDLRFHNVLATASGNQRLRADITRYRHLVRAFWRMSGRVENLRQAMEEHRRILRALEARDPAAARRAMIAHVEARLQAVLHELDEADQTAGNGKPSK